MRRVFPLVLIFILIGGLFALSQGMKKNVSAGDDDDDDQQQQQQQPAKPQAPPQGAAASQASDPIPPEITVGDPAKAKYKVTLGWSYDESLAAHPEHAQQTIQMLQEWAKTKPNVSLEVVNLDVPKTDLSPAAASVPGIGLAVNGSHTVGRGHFDTNLSSGVMTPPEVMPQLIAATSK